MVDARRGLSIGAYALIMMALVLLAFLSYAAFTFTEFQRVRADIQASSRAAARAEIHGVMDRLRVEAERTAERFAASNLVSRRLYHDSKRSHVSLPPLASQLPDTVIAAEIYDRAGGEVGNPGYGILPRQAAIPLYGDYIEYVDGEPTLTLFRPVGASVGVGTPEVLGYVGLRIRFLQSLREGQAYLYVDPQTIDFGPWPAETLTWSALKSAVRFRLRYSPMSEVVSALLSDAILNLSIILGVFALTLFPALVFLIVRPLRAISAHIDRLKSSPGGLMLGDLAGILPIAETEKIRHSLNEYQSQLIDVHSSLEEKSQQLWEMAHHDALTGAKNRRAFDEFIQNLAQVLGERDVCFALFDVNQFKAINDSYGHNIGDQVLKAIADRIRSALRKGEELFRIGGDEFAVILLDCDEPTALRIAESCHQQVVGFDFGKLGIREPLRISAGLASARILVPDDVQSLQWKADVAMYRAKRPGHSSVVMFSEALARDSEGLFSSWVNTAVFDAVISGRGLRMAYQPIVDLGDGRICHYEALVRIQRDGELIYPSNIFPVVEARRLEVELDRAVIRQVLADLAAGKVRPGTGVSINLSGPTLVQDRVCSWLRGFLPYLKDFRVMIEVTETALITQIGLANENLARLRRRGFDIALDDFGSGYSSVRYLASMPVDVVKFDISLIQELRDPVQGNMVRHLAQMILESGHQLVAEGIEDRVVLEAARAAGFVLGQGYLTGRPAEKAHCAKLVLDNVALFPRDLRA